MQVGEELSPEQEWCPACLQPGAPQSHLSAPGDPVPSKVHTQAGHRGWWSSEWVIPRRVCKKSGSLHGIQLPSTDPGSLWVSLPEVKGQSHFPSQDQLGGALTSIATGWPGWQRRPWAGLKSFKHLLIFLVVFTAPFSSSVMNLYEW